MAISGHTSPQVVVNSSANANPYTGNITVGSTSDLVVLFIQGWTGTGGHDPTTWTVTVDGSAITPSHSQGSSAVSLAGAIYELTGLAAGARALSVSFGAAGRGCQAIAYVITGQDTTTPVAARNGNASYAGDVATLGFTTTTGADGNLLVSVMGNRENVAGAEYSLTGGTLIGTSTTGGVDTSDITAAYGYHEVATAGSVTDTYSWTDTGRCHVLWAEINLATGGGGGVTGTLAATETGADTFTGSGAVEVSGALAASEAGLDVLAATGAVAVSGALAALEIGADVFSGSGSAIDLPVTGTMAAVEIGADVFFGASDISLRRVAYAYESANGGRVIPQANGGSFRPTRTGGTFAATANGGKLLG